MNKLIDCELSDADLKLTPAAFYLKFIEPALLKVRADRNWKRRSFSIWLHYQPERMWRKQQSKT